MQFDGSYFVALLERLKEEAITDKKALRLLCGSYKRNFTRPALFVLEGNSTKIIPKKMQRHPTIAETESCSFATRTPVNAKKTGSIAKIIATLVGDVCFALMFG